MVDPKQKSLDASPYLRRFLPSWVAPLWTDAARWRATVRNQPISIICRDRLIAYVQALPWDIRAKDTKEESKLEEDIRYYKEYVLKDFDSLIDLIWQDALDLPIGGNVEIVRFPSNVVPTVKIDGDSYKVTRPSPRGHVFKVVHVDGATLTPTYDPQFPMMQRVPENFTNPIFFDPNEMARILLTPRPEFNAKGFGMPPPQRVFLSISLLFRGDQYYANLLLDTPEAGVLDLLDMDEDDAFKWVESYKTMLQGVDPMKIGVLYQHEKPAVWIPFGRPPTDMMFDQTTLKYARITAAGYWMTLKDIGLDPQGGTLAGEIRRQRESRLTGFGVVWEKTKNFINQNVLPPYLEFDFIEKDDEAMANTGRARLVNGQALKAMKEAGFITEDEGQAQLLKDGLITIELEVPSKRPKPEMPQLPPGNQHGNVAMPDPAEQANTERDRIPPSQGGRGDVGIQRAAIGDDVSAAPPESPLFGELAGIFRTGFDDMLFKMGDAQLTRLIKGAARIQFPIASKAMIGLDASDRERWATERAKAWFEQKSIFDEIPQIQKIDRETLDRLEELLEADRWWALPANIVAKALEIIKAAFAEGAVTAADLVYRFLYEEGLVDSPMIGLDFELKNRRTLDELNAHAADLVRRVNDGTKYYLKRVITAGVDEGLSSQEIALRIQEGESLDDILRESGLVQRVMGQARKQIDSLSSERVTSIVNTEIARAETDGRVGQWKHMGLTRKRWSHTGPDVPCSVCQANIDMGYVGIDFKYTSVFGTDDVSGPPAHPQVDHCHIEFEEKELIDKAGDLSVWDGS